MRSGLTAAPPLSVDLLAQRGGRVALVFALAGTVLCGCPGEPPPVGAPQVGQDAEQRGEEPLGSAGPAAGDDRAVADPSGADPSAADPAGADLAVGGGRVARDAEPNDDWLHALELVPGVTAVGLVDRPEDPKVGDQDWYVVQVPAGGPAVLSATLSGAEDLDVVLEWMPRDDREDTPLRAIVQADVIERAPGTERLPNLRVDPGPVYLRVREAWYRGAARTGSDRPYRLDVSLDRWTPDLEAEPDDSPEQATTLALGAAGTGTLATIGDRDVWRVAVPPDLEAERARIQVSGLVGVDLELSVTLPADGGSLTARAPAPGAGVALRNVDVTGARGADLLVTVRARDGAAPQAPYALQVEEEPGGDPSEREPNDARTRANSIVVGPRTTGFISHAGDVDTYTFEAPADRTVHALLMPPGESNLSVELLDSTGNSTLRLDAGGAGQEEVIRSYGLAAGQWFLVVRAVGKQSADSNRPYALELTLGDPAIDEREPNDERTAEGISPLVVGVTRRGWMHPAGDVDWWRLTIPGADGEGSITTFRATAPPGMTVDLDIHSDSGERVTGRPGVAAGEPTTFTHFFGPGDYWVRVASSDARMANPSEPYELTVVP